MKVEQQVISIEVAKKLKSLGVKQESLSWWVDCDGKWCLATSRWYRHTAPDHPGKHYSAFTVAELGEMLPQLTKSWCSAFGWYCENKENNYELKGFTHGESTEADARGKMLIYLIENKLMEVPR